LQVRDRIFLLLGFGLAFGRPFSGESSARPERDSVLIPITTKSGGDVRPAFCVCYMAKKCLVFGFLELQYLLTWKV
jgi:hypothetical protein